MIKNQRKEKLWQDQKKKFRRKRKNCIMLRLSDTEYEIVTNYAKEAGYPSAVYARKQILEMSIQIPLCINPNLKNIGYK